MKVIKSIKLFFFGLAALGFVSAQATFYKYDIFRKLVVRNGVAKYQYRIGMHDWHADYVDGRSRKKQQFQFLNSAQHLQKQGKSVRVIVEEMSHYQGTNDAIRATLQKIEKAIRNSETYWSKHTPLVTDVQSNGSMSWLTSMCNKAGIPCKNVEFRHASNISLREANGYKPTRSEILRDIDASLAKINASPEFTKQFEMELSLINTLYKGCIVAPNLAHGPSDLTQQELASIYRLKLHMLDAFIIIELLNYEDQDIDYAFIAAGGAHLDALETRHFSTYWTKLGYEKIAEISIPVAIEEEYEADILRYSYDQNFDAFMQQYLPDCQHLDRPAQPAPTYKRTTRKITAKKTAIATAAKKIAAHKTPKKVIKKPVKRIVKKNAPKKPIKPAAKKPVKQVAKTPAPRKASPKRPAVGKKQAPKKLTKKRVVKKRPATKKPSLPTTIANNLHTIITAHPTDIIATLQRIPYSTRRAAWASLDLHLYRALVCYRYNGNDYLLPLDEYRGLVEPLGQVINSPSKTEMAQKLPLVKANALAKLFASPNFVAALATLSREDQKKLSTITQQFITAHKPRIVRKIVRKPAAKRRIAGRVR